MADTVLTELKIHEFDSVEQMSQYGSEIGENDMVYTPDTSIRLPILTPMWFDHQVNDESWLNADTFSWQPSARYKQTYDHLANDINGKALQSEAVGDITVQFYLADDGHKICPASEESNLIALYEATGVAWYYILDADNQQFKLPRTKWGFTGLRDAVGGYVEAGLPNITGYIGSNVMVGSNATGAFKATNTVSSSAYDSSNHSKTASDASFDASRSNAAYGNSDTVQPPATQMYLYFWVGAFDQTATEQTAGLNAELFNNKADVDFGNVSNAAKELMANSSMPSGAYTDLTLGASGTTYIAPADGWFVVNKVSNGTNQYANLTNQINNMTIEVRGPNNGTLCACFMPAKAGDVVACTYSAAGATKYFRFVYAGGAKHLAA